MRMTENCMRMTDRIPVVHDQHAHVLSSNSTDISDALCNSICRTWVCAARDQDVYLEFNFYLSASMPQGITKGEQRSKDIYSYVED